MERMFGLYHRSDERDFREDLFVETGLYAEVCDHGPALGACVRLYNDGNEIVDRYHFTHARDAVNALRIAGFAARVAGAECEPELMEGTALLSTTPPTPIVNVHIHNAPVDVATLEQIIREATQQSKSKPAA